MISLYNNWIEAKFLARPNRFVMVLEYHGKAIKAYVPNTGRMSEFCLPDQIFYLTKMKMPKFEYKVIGTRYQNNFVFLDTIKINTVFQEILRCRSIEQFSDFSKIRREVSLANSRFDFLLEREQKADQIIEIKSCTLCHNGIAMFPDAPTTRGQRHLSDLDELATKGYESHIVYLITNPSARKFLPNYHTDYTYAKIFNAKKKVEASAWIPEFVDPITLAAAKVSKVEIDYTAIRDNTIDKGAYLLMIENDQKREIEVGKLGVIVFEPGFYIYTGSAMNSLSARINRHQRKKKKIHWHIDYILQEMKLLKVYPIMMKRNKEFEIASRMLEISKSAIKRFGSSDSNLSSHLTFFDKNPLQNKEFIKALLDFRMDI